MFPILQLGPFAIRLPGLIALAAVWVGLDIGAREGKRLGLSAEHVYNAGFYGLVSGVIGARVWYVATYWSVYRTELLAIFSLNPATLSPIGGVIVGLLAVTWYVRRHALPLRVFLDSTALASAVFAAGLALMNLASGDAFGVSTRLPWAVYLWDDYRHPIQVYDFLGPRHPVGSMASPAQPAFRWFPVSCVRCIVRLGASLAGTAARG
jgi:phosphatidylglycerol:prolipoprotein diacylglycerol transferase